MENESVSAKSSKLEYRSGKDVGSNPSALATTKEFFWWCVIADMFIIIFIEAAFRK